MNPRAMAGRLSRRQQRQLRPRQQPPLLLFRHPLAAPGRRKKMSSSMADPAIPTAAVVTVSDSCSRGEREDRSGPAVAQLLGTLQFTVVSREVVPDDSIQIQTLLIRLAREVRFVVTTGGT